MDNMLEIEDGLFAIMKDIFQQSSEKLMMDGNVPPTIYPIIQEGSEYKICDPINIVREVTGEEYAECDNDCDNCVHGEVHLMDKVMIKLIETRATYAIMCGQVLSVSIGDSGIPEHVGELLVCSLMDSKGAIKDQLLATRIQTRIDSKDRVLKYVDIREVINKIPENNTRVIPPWETE